MCHHHPALPSGEVVLWRDALFLVSCDKVQEEGEEVTNIADVLQLEN